MSAIARNNVLIVQSGGCTAVMNRSLVGVVKELFEHRVFGKEYGSIHGLQGIIDEDFIDLRGVPSGVWTRIAKTPGAALGSGRRRLVEEDVPGVLDSLHKHRIGYLFAVGGNDTAETAHRIAAETEAAAQVVTVMHVPKTIDNDLMATDHTPGYGSAARFVALATMGAGRDAEAMGEASPVTILEVMGRDAGWLAASSALGKRDDMDPPHFICVPEVTVDEDLFLGRMEDSLRQWGYAVAVTSENAKGPHGPLAEDQDPFYIDDFGHEYFEGPGRYLAQLVGRRLKVRARFEKPGTIQRSLMPCVSRSDAQEAFLVGQAAVGYALEGYSDSMVTLLRQSGARYECDTGIAPLEEIAGQVKALPSEYIDPSVGYVTEAFFKYARPLLGGPIPRYARMAKPVRIVRAKEGG